MLEQLYTLYCYIYFDIYIVYIQISNIRRNLVGYDDQPNVVGASPVGTAPTTFSLST